MDKRPKPMSPESYGRAKQTAIVDFTVRNTSHIRRMTSIFIALGIATSTCSSSSPTPDETAKTLASPTSTIPASPNRPMSGTRGLYDPYYPNNGNGGYDASHYDISIDWDATTDQIDATTVITATTTATLADFSFDYAGPPINDVELNGAAVDYELVDRKLVLTPAEPINNGETIRVVVEYQGKPKPISNWLGWQKIGGITATLNEPVGASNWYPVNDHPTDKANYTISVETPSAYTAASNGTLVSSEATGKDRITWLWETTQPQASYLTAVFIGEFDMIEDTSSSGVRIRSFLPSNTELPERVVEEVENLPDLMDNLEAVFGPYPFENYGVTVTPEPLGTALETQTNSIFGINSAQSNATMIHELAHQWLGNSVSLSSWNDIWLKEGFATYAVFLYREQRWPDYDIYRALERFARGSADLPAPGDPGRRNLYGEAVYDRGALTIHALRLTVGEATFWEIVEQWIEQGRNASATTVNLKELAEEISGQDLDSFFVNWLHNPDLPELPAR